MALNHTLSGPWAQTVNQKPALLDSFTHMLGGHLNLHRGAPLPLFWLRFSDCDGQSYCSQQRATTQVEKWDRQSVEAWRIDLLL